MVTCGTPISLQISSHIFTPLPYAPARNLFPTPFLILSLLIIPDLAGLEKRDLSSAKLGSGTVAKSTMYYTSTVLTARPPSRLPSSIVLVRLQTEEGDHNICHDCKDKPHQAPCGSCHCAFPSADIFLVSEVLKQNMSYVDEVKTAFICIMCVDELERSICGPCYGSFPPDELIFSSRTACYAKNSHICASCFDTDHDKAGQRPERPSRACPLSMKKLSGTWE